MWLAMALLPVYFVLWTKRFFDKRAQLQIGVSGLRWLPWSSQVIPWTEVSNVTTSSVKRQKLIVLHLHSPEKFSGQGFAAMLARIVPMTREGHIRIALMATDRSFDDAMVAIAHFRGLPVQS
jgi:hypothetical protein